MWKLIKFLLTGSWHEHEWETLKQINVHNQYEADIPRRIDYVLRYKRCGIIKTVKGKQT